MLTILLLILAIIWTSWKALRFERVSRWEQVIIPGYSFIMFLVHMDWTGKNFLIAVCILLLARIIVAYQFKDVQIKKSDRVDRFERPVAELKKGKSFVFGWILVLLLGFCLNLFLLGLDRYHLLEELLLEVGKEVFSLSIFWTKGEWYIWFLAAAVGSIYTGLLLKKYPELKESIRRRKRRKL